MCCIRAPSGGSHASNKQLPLWPLILLWRTACVQSSLSFCLCLFSPSLIPLSHSVSVTVFFFPCSSSSCLSFHLSIVLLLSSVSFLSLHILCDEAVKLLHIVTPFVFIIIILILIFFFLFFFFFFCQYMYIHLLCCRYVHKSLKRTQLCRTELDIAVKVVIFMQQQLLSLSSCRLYRVLRMRLKAASDVVFRVRHMRLKTAPAVVYRVLHMRLKTASAVVFLEDSSTQRIEKATFS